MMPSHGLSSIPCLLHLIAEEWVNDVFAEQCKRINGLIGWNINKPISGGHTKARAELTEADVGLAISFCGAQSLLRLLSLCRVWVSREHGLCISDLVEVGAS